MPTTYNVAEACKLLGVTKLTIWRWVKRGKLPDRRIPGTRKLLFLHDDLLPSIPAQQPSETPAQ